MILSIIVFHMHFTTRYVLKNVWRDWSANAAPERAQSYGRCCEELAARLGPPTAQPQQVLVPGCGLARLCCEIAGLVGSGCAHHCDVDRRLTGQHTPNDNALVAYARHISIALLHLCMASINTVHVIKCMAATAATCTNTKTSNKRKTNSTQKTHVASHCTGICSSGQ